MMLSVKVFNHGLTEKTFQLNLSHLVLLID